MTWIRTVSLTQGDERVRKAVAAARALYPEEYRERVPAACAEEAAGKSDAGIMGSHSLLPDTLYHAFAAYGTLMAPELPLSRRQHEMIATMVSVTNRCHY